MPSRRPRPLRVPFPVAFVLSVLFVLLHGAQPVAAGPARVTALRVESLTDPIGLDTRTPRFSWIVESSERGARQEAYQILVSSSPVLLARGEGDVWDSGKVTSPENANVVYDGQDLLARQRYHFTVRVWDGAGREIRAAKPGFFEMGVLDFAAWRGRFIGAKPTRDEDRPPLAAGKWIWAPEPRESSRIKRAGFRTAFALTPQERVRWAELVIAAPGQRALWSKQNPHRLWLNGKLRAEWNAPVSDPRLFVVTDALRAGDNRLAIEVPYGDRGALIAALRIELADGQVRVVATDGRWRQRLFETLEPDPSWLEEPTEARPWAAAEVRGAFGETVDPMEPGYRGIDKILPVVHVRKAFVVRKPVARARLYATAAGVYDAFLNGRKVGRDVLAPGWTDYTRRLRYQTYDVTAAVRPGDNVIGAMIADGWFSGRTGFGQNLWGFERAFFGELHLDYKDGGSEVIVTDESWQAATGPLRRADLLDGEVFDARKDLGNWSGPRIDAKTSNAWSPVAVMMPRVGRLEAQPEPPIRSIEVRKAVASTSPAPGVQIFDLGQNIVGWIRVTLQAPAGTTIALRYGEMLNKDGSLFTANLRTANAVDRYIARGRGPETYEPRFTFHGFRYIEVTGLPRPLPATALAGVVVHNDLPFTGKFETSSALVNRLQQNIVWGQRGNFLTVPTDCPQRDERLGWSGDINVFGRTAAFNMDVRAFLAKYLVDLQDGQREDGRFPDVAPSSPLLGAGAYGWADAGVMLPWLLYQSYGDTRVLERHYDAMKKWVDFRTRGAKDFLNTAGGWGDWVSPEPKAPHAVIGPVFHAASARLLGRIAGVLGKAEDAARYEELFQNIRAAWTKAYVGPDGKITSDTQTAYVLALRYEMLDDEARAQAAQHLAAAIARANGHLATGFLGTANLLPALSAAGRHDLAFDLLLKDSFPSWLYTVKNGATTMWERWDSYSPETGPSNKGDMNSYNHYAFGAVGEWMYAHVAGLDSDPTAPAWRRVIVRPQIGGGLTHARGEYLSVRGRTVSAWRLEPKALTLDVEIPVHSTALVHVPATSADAVKEGARPARGAPGVKFVEMKEGAAVFEVGAGRYRFVVPR